MNIKKIIREEFEDLDWIDSVKTKWDAYNIHLIAGKKFYHKDFPKQIYWFEDDIKAKRPEIKYRIPMPNIGVCNDKKDVWTGERKSKCFPNRRWQIIKLLNDSEWVLTNSNINELNDFDWVQDIEPSRRDKQDFSRSNILKTKDTTIMFGNDVNVGDKFLPPNSANIWELVGIVKKYERPMAVIEDYLVRMETEDGKKKHVWWEKPIKHTQPNGTFPRRHRPWRKIIEPITESGDDFGWVSDTFHTKFTLSDILKLHNDNNITMVEVVDINEDYLRAASLHCENNENYVLNHVRVGNEFFIGENGDQHRRGGQDCESSELFGLDSNETVTSIKLVSLDDGFTWWVNDDMVTLKPVPKGGVNESIDDGLEWMRDIVPDGKVLVKGRVEDFIRMVEDDWEGFEFTIEDITDTYSSGVTELCRVWVDDLINDDSWYWDVLMDDNSYIVEIYEKHGGSYEIIDTTRFHILNDAIMYMFTSISEE
jgi:hypothetical protein